MTLMITVYNPDERQNAYVWIMPFNCVRCGNPLVNSVIVDKEDGTIECSKCKLWHTVM